MLVSRDVYAEMVDHALAERPNEACGMIAATGERLTAFFPATNEFASPMRFQIDSADQIRIYNEIDVRGEGVAIFHSHPNTEAYPSQTDVNLAAAWPGAVWVIASLAGPDPILRAFEIDGPSVAEVALEVVDG